MNYDSNPIALGMILKEVEAFSSKYDFIIDCSVSGNTVFVQKDGIDLYDYGGHVSLTTALSKCLEYLYGINKTPEEDTLFYKIENDV